MSVARHPLRLATSGARIIMEVYRRHSSGMSSNLSQSLVDTVLKEKLVKMQN